MVRGNPELLALNYDYSEDRNVLSNAKVSGLCETMTNPIKIVLNGEPRETPAALNVLQLLRHLELPPDRVAVELNRSIVRKAEWESTVVEDGAQVEVVMFVGGG